MTTKTDNVKIGDYVRGLIMGKKHTPKEIVDLASDKYPDSAVDEKHVAWYKWDMKKRGIIPKNFEIPTSRKSKKPAPKAKPAPARRKTRARRKTSPRRKTA